jgi:hypothetical protein
VATARQAEVGTADLQPPVLLRGGEHLVKKRRVGVLEGDPLGEGALRFGDADGESVAELLELTEPEHPRRSGGADPVRDVDPAEALGDEPGQPQLKPPDLPSQLGPRAGLAEQPVVFGHPLGDKGQPVGIRRSPVEQIRHSGSLSALEGRCSNP